MNVTELVENLRTQREELTEARDEARAMRASAGQRVKDLTVELTRVDRLLRAAEGRKRGSA